MMPADISLWYSATSDNDNFCLTCNSAAEKSFKAFCKYFGLHMETEANRFFTTEIQNLCLFLSRAEPQS